MFCKDSSVSASGTIGPGMRDKGLEIAFFLSFSGKFSSAISPPLRDDDDDDDDGDDDGINVNGSFDSKVDDPVGAFVSKVFGGSFSVIS
jgi:hypothetical protein